MSRYVLGIDAGATKVIGCVESLSGDHSFTQRDGPCSLTNQRAQTIERLQGLIRSLLTEADAAAEEITLVCGIAGAGHEQGRQALELVLDTYGFANYFITSDAVTSLYGAGQGKPMISVAIGTGSVAMRLDENGELREFGGWGFKLGDEGSGSYIGRELIRHALPCFDRDDYRSDELLSELFNRIGNTRNDILDWSKNADPSDYAALSKLLMDYPHHPITSELLNQATQHIVDLISNAQPARPLPVALQGGLARVIGPRLPDAIQVQLINPIGNAVDGALYMARNFNEVTP